MAANKSTIITKYAKMWPREVFDIKEGQKLLGSVRELLKESGVYILYRDDHPYYVGKTERPLFNRIWAHANSSRDKYFNFWNYFSAFVVPSGKHLSEIEGILIASMPTANSATPRITQIRIPAKVARIMRKARQERLSFE